MIDESLLSREFITFLYGNLECADMGMCTLY